MGADNLNKKEIKDIPYVDPETKVKYGMKWHDFLCIFFVYFGCIFAVYGCYIFYRKGRVSVAI